jgi:hypothetical protein
MTLRDKVDKAEGQNDQKGARRVPNLALQGGAAMAHLPGVYLIASSKKRRSTLRVSQERALEQLTRLYSPMVLLLAAAKRQGERCENIGVESPNFGLVAPSNLRLFLEGIPILD